MDKVMQFLMSVVMLVLVVYGVLYFFSIEVGDLMDWIVGVASFVWLIVIVTVPWNAHFKAKEVLDEAAISKRKDILVIDSSLEYVERVAKRSFYIAVGLHIFSAAVMYVVATLGISPVGYFGAIAALLLTFLRPTVRFYEYLQKRLNNIRQEFRFPREDVQEILSQFKAMQAQVEVLEATLETDKNKPNSWRKEVGQKHLAIQKEINELQLMLDNVQENTATEFQVIKADAKKNFDKLISDSRILDSVRVLSGFIKEMKQ